MDTKKITIQKVGAEEKPPEVKAGARKTIKTFPRGILKKKQKFTLKGVTDPAKAPSLKKGMRRHTLRMLTEKGLKKQRKTLKNKIAQMKDREVRELVIKKGLAPNPKTPPEISRQILDNAVSAGFISI
jgi:hypothetical protein